MSTTLNHIAETTSNTSPAKRIEKILLFCLLLVPFGLDAQTIEFLPKNICSISWEMKTIQSQNHFTSGTSKETLMLNRLLKDNYNKEDVTGSIKYETSQQTVFFQYGLFRSVNLGIAVPYIRRKRLSNLTVHQANATDFVDKYKSVESNGMGDLEIRGWWRLFYSDEMDFQLGLVVNGDNATSTFYERDELALGSGTQELSAFLRWKIYATDSSLQTTIEANTTATKNTTVTDDNDRNLKLSRGNTMFASINLSKNADPFYFGGGLQVRSQAETIVDKIKQEDGYLGYAANVFFNYGNLYLLEESPINFPWEIHVHLKSTLAGVDAPEIREIGVKASFYF
ncbi:MAG: hypothetical protein GY866_12325 [Proteobacteria bacterium]|nr:hypothetical protein [Pseudomonadota bacterium]